MNIGGIGKVAGILTSLFNADGSVIENAKTTEGRELLISNGNVVTLLGNMIVEPRLNVPRALQSHPHLDKVLEKQMSTFVGIYTMGFEHMVNNLGVDVSTSLRLMSTNPKNLASTVNDLTAESFTPDLEDFNYDKTTEDKDSNDGFNLFKKIQMEFGNKDSKVIVNVIVKASVSFVNIGNIELLLEDNDPNVNGFWARLDEARSGGISWTEFWFPMDMIKKSRKRRLMDKDDLIKDMREMSDNAYMKVATEGAVGFGKNYRFLVISAMDKARLEKAIGKRFANGGAMELISAINLMGITVMDDDRDMISTYITSTSGKLSQSYKSLSKKDGGKTDDILAYLAGMR